MIMLRMNSIEEISNQLERERAQEFHLLLENFVEMDNKIVQLSSDIDRFMVEIRENSESTKPIKTNNWDSIRQAFKGPTRIEINERN